MAAIILRASAKATWPGARAGMPAQARDMVQRVIAGAAATIMICAVGVALVQLVAEILSFPAPIAVTGVTLMALALLKSLRRRLRIRAANWSGPGNLHGLRR